MKKAQVTTFIIAGILIVAVIFFMLWLRGSFTTIGRQYSLEETMDAVNQHISTCLSQVSEQQTILIGKQGGFLNVADSSYRLYNDTKISYLCYNLDDSKKCRTRILLREDMEKYVNDNIQLLLSSCINLNTFKNNQVSIIAGNDYDVDTNIGDNTIIITLNYPVKVISKQNNAQLENSQYTSVINYPLGRLYNTALSIISEEALVGEFDPLPYMLTHQGIRIQKLRPYPDKLYILSMQGSPYIFQFAIQG